MPGRPADHKSKYRKYLYNPTRPKLSKEERDDIHLHFPRGGAEACTVALRRRSLKAVGIWAYRHKIRYLGIFKPKHLRELRRKYRKHGASGCKLCLESFSVKQIVWRARELGLAGRKSHAYWNVREDNELKRRYRKHGAAGCPLASERHSVRAIYRRAQQLRLTKLGQAPRSRVDWRPSEDAELKRRYRKHGPAGCPSASERHSRLAIYKRAQKLGLTRSSV